MKKYLLTSISSFLLVFAVSSNTIEDEQPRSAYVRGRFQFYDNRCHACHVLDGQGGQEGPTLTNARANLSARLLTDEYDTWLRNLSQRDSAYFENYRGAYQDLLNLTGRDRLRAWLRYHLLDPRFDNPKAKMPSHDLSRDAIDAITEFLLD